MQLALVVSRLAALVDLQRYYRPDRAVIARIPARELERLDVLVVVLRDEACDQRTDARPLQGVDRVDHRRQVAGLRCLEHPRSVTAEGVSPVQPWTEVECEAKDYQNQDD